MTVHSNNRQIVVRSASGEGFEAALSHVEQQGKHTVVIATTAKHQARLEEHAGLFARLLCRQHHVTPAQLTYFERSENGTLSQVELVSPVPTNAAQKERTVSPGKRVAASEATVEKKLGVADMPVVVPMVILTKIAVQMTREMGHAAQNIAKRMLGQERPRTQRPRYQRPQ